MLSSRGSRPPQQVSGLAGPNQYVRGTLCGAVAPASLQSARSTRDRSASPPGRLRAESPDGQVAHWCDSNNVSPLPTARRTTSPRQPQQPAAQAKAILTSGMPQVVVADARVPIPPRVGPYAASALPKAPYTPQALVAQRQLRLASGGRAHQAELLQRSAPALPQASNNLGSASASSQLISVPVEHAGGNESGLNVTIGSTDGSVVEGELFIYRPPQWSDLSRAMIYVESGEELIHLQPRWMVLRPSNGPLLWVNLRQPMVCNGQDILSIKWAAPSTVTSNAPSIKSIRLTLMEGSGGGSWDELAENEALVRLSDRPQGRATLDASCGQTLRIWLWHAQKAGVAI
eukprot:gnl/TRDRNA2_/TRDRNA2_149578_c0_seq3.p1 gnl/TRDRNA2_/TRDRNA2_149578_c0~~gnl/TRDRNA2_/TRDRNA2_149578_c0_seq3.p1  ORF type:complete len:345 (-),score=28.03 gnl/TRDRNA2_/TRDRNA2_149578_c0_seq3:51-1085(-)